MVEFNDLMCKSCSNFLSIGWKLMILEIWQSCWHLAYVDLLTLKSSFLASDQPYHLVMFREDRFKIVTCRRLTYKQTESHSRTTNIFANLRFCKYIGQSILLFCLSVCQSPTGHNFKPIFTKLHHMVEFVIRKKPIVFEVKRTK